MAISKRTYPSKAWINIKTGETYPTNDFLGFVLAHPQIFNLTENDVDDLKKEDETIVNLADHVWNKIYKNFKFAANYIEKKKEESGNITYIYDKKHIDKRNKAKAKKVRKLIKSILSLRKQLKKDINNEDPKISIPALAVSIIDETYERVGNRYSAKDLKHYGVTTWLTKHISFQNQSAVLKYVGKSGVKQKKTISDKKLVKLLKKLTKDKSPSDLIFQIDSYTLNDNLVNKYLRPFNITAKDIRGMHANREMKENLKKIKNTKKDRKEEFKKALEETAKEVGHEPSTLKNQYLIPGFEEKYISTGKISNQDFQLSKRAIKLPNLDEIWDFVEEVYEVFVYSFVTSLPDNKEMHRIIENINPNNRRFTKSISETKYFKINKDWPYKIDKNYKFMVSVVDSFGDSSILGDWNNLTYNITLFFNFNKIDSLKSFNEYKNKLKNTLEHEIRHAIQTFKSLELNTNFGLPKKNVRFDTHGFKGFPKNIEKKMFDLETQIYNADGRKKEKLIRKYYNIVGSIDEVNIHVLTKIILDKNLSKDKKKEKIKDYIGDKRLPHVVRDIEFFPNLYTIATDFKNKIKPHMSKNKAFNSFIGNDRYEGIKPNNRLLWLKFLSPKRWKESVKKLHKIINFETNITANQDFQLSKRAIKLPNLDEIWNFVEEVYERAVYKDLKQRMIFTSEKINELKETFWNIYTNASEFLNKEAEIIDDFGRNIQILTTTYDGNLYKIFVDGKLKYQFDHKADFIDELERIFYEGYELVQEFEPDDDNEIVEETLLKKEIKHKEPINSIEQFKKFEVNPSEWPYEINKPYFFTVYITKDCDIDTFGKWDKDNYKMIICVKEYQLDSVNDLIYYKNQLKDTLEHEIRHAIQTFKSKDLNLSQKNPFGLPSKKKRRLKPTEYDPYGESLYDSSDEKQLHALRNIEFYPNLFAAINKFKSLSKNIPTPELDQAMKKFIDPDEQYDKIQTEPLFKTLKEKSYWKWKLAVKQFYKNMESFENLQLSKRANNKIQKWIDDNVKGNEPFFYSTVLSILFPQLTLKKNDSNYFWTELNDQIYDPTKLNDPVDGFTVNKNVDLVLSHPLFHSLITQDQETLKSQDISGLQKRKSKIDITPDYYSNLEDELHHFNEYLKNIENPAKSFQDVVKDYIQLSTTFKKPKTEKEWQYAVKEFYKALAYNFFPLSKRGG